MNTTELSIISFITLFFLTLTVKWLIKKYPGIICKLTGKHKAGSLIILIDQHGNITRYERCWRCKYEKETDTNSKKPQGSGGVRVTFYFSADDVEPFPEIGQIPVIKTKPKTEQLKSMIDTSPDNRLQIHLETAIYREDYELAAYIKEVAIKRGVKLKLY